MYDIAMHEAGDDFETCWQAARRHLSAQPRNATTGWIKASPSPPFLEHVSFRIGNQLIFVRLEDEDGRLDVPGNRDGLLHVAENCRGHACIMPMRLAAGEWRPSRSGWGLIDAGSGADVDPTALVTDEPIEMSDWEVQDFAVQVMRTELGRSKLEVLGFSGDPDVKPSIWFERHGRREWLAVASARFPETRMFVPGEWRDLAERCRTLSDRGYFAAICVASMDDAALPLWRGHALTARVTDLQVVPAP